MTDILNFSRRNTPEVLANEFLRFYFRDKPIIYPLDPFQMLRDVGVTFVLKNFDKLEGIYIPATSEDDIPFVGINFQRPITRQRFTAAHELCHHLRDSDKHIACPIGQKDECEKFADNFAAEILMPMTEMRRQTDPKRNSSGYVSFDDALEIADYFGVSFESCIYRLAYKLHAIDGDIDRDELRKRITRYRPDAKRKEKNMHSLNLFEGLVNAYVDVLDFQPSEHARLIFQNQYIYNDSRLEGLQTTLEEAAEIVADLRLNTQHSRYCSESNEAFLSIAGHYEMYREIFSPPTKETCSVFDMVGLHRKLFSFYPHPEYGGSFRQIDTLVMGAKFETFPPHQIVSKLIEVDADLNELLAKRDELLLSEFLEGLFRIHHRLAVIHPFGDGNGRTLRAFLNVLLVRSNISPLYVKMDEKAEYVSALNLADTENSYIALYECLLKCLLRSSVDLNEN